LAKIYFAEYEGKVLCANMMIFYGDTATYLHGGSSSADKNIMAPHLLQWEQIKLAKAKGYKYYDFWGIDEIKWPGVTRFKKGFGGFEVDYGGTWELAITKWKYTLYKLIKRIK
jgi:lipid II:glycine glycyltransferase (peptidoglycan interpeptide bridge formation enzyme)